MLVGLILLGILEKVFLAAVLATGAYLGFRYVRAAEGRGKGSDVEQLRGQVQLLQEAVDSLRADLERVQEGQDFTTRLLSERSSKKV